MTYYDWREEIKGLRGQRDMVLPKRRDVSFKRWK